jgi:hypothetical protein
LTGSADSGTRDDRSDADPAVGDQRERRRAQARAWASRLPSGWTPLELLKHLAYMERRWLCWGFRAEQLPDPHGDEDPRPLRILTYVLQEYARHAGHLDVAREVIDGTTGELPGVVGARENRTTGRRGGSAPVLR